MERNKMELEKFKVEITADKRKADELYSLLSNAESDFMDLPPVPVTAIKDFLEDKRDNLWQVTLDDEVYLTVMSDKPSASALLKMVKGAGVEDFPLAPLPAKNLRAFVNGQRDSVATLEIRRNTDVQVRVKPEKAKEKEVKVEKPKVEKARKDEKKTEVEED